MRFYLLLSVITLPAAVGSAQPLPDSEEALTVESAVFNVSVPEQEWLSGGHLQGVQLHNDILFVSGSSKQTAYLAILKWTGSDFQFLGTKKLATLPLNHAGGFQITENWLAVGVEDPRKKKRSIIQLIDVSNAQTVSQPPTYTLERTGEPKLSTAGAVAILRRNDHLLLAVGTWDCTTIDFYTSNSLDPHREYFEFSHWTTWDSREAIRKNWSDKGYCSYQNLQLTEDSTGVYITGFCREQNGTDRADVYQLTTDSDPFNLLRKVASYSVQCRGDVTFRNGAGLCTFKGSPAIIAIGRDLHPELHVQVFPIKR